MNALYDLPAPAKLNLFLHITGRRADGYHLLQSVFMLIDWCDILHIEQRPRGQLSRQDLSAPLPDDDLCLRAARALQAATGCTMGAHITIEKNLPAQAGLGGGSSDAATCLLALNQLWKLHLSLNQLLKIGLQLGADVPFFLQGHNAWVQGIGEDITPLIGASALPAAQFVVVKPQAGLATAAIFSDPALKRDCEAATITGFAADPYRFGKNVLQDVAQNNCPEVTQALHWLQAQALTPEFNGRMTGSGSAVFAQKTQSVDLCPAPRGWFVKECKNLMAHPLVGWAVSDNSSVDG